MKQPTFCGRELLPLSVIEAARAGDPLAVERVLWYCSMPCSVRKFIVFAACFKFSSFAQRA